MLDELEQGRRVLLGNAHQLVQRISADYVVEDCNQEGHLEGEETISELDVGYWTGLAVFGEVSLFQDDRHVFGLEVGVDHAQAVHFAQALEQPLGYILVRLP